MSLRTLDRLPNLAGRRVFLRVDLNVPLSDGRVADDSRVRASLPTLRELRERGAAVVLASHLGRPKGVVHPELSLLPIRDRLAELLGAPVEMAEGPAPPELPDDPIVLLENLRFDEGEEANDVSFAGRLAELADVYVDDAFGAVHRAHASVSALPELMIASGRPAVAGRLLEREVVVLGRLLDAPDRPFVAVLGGAKVSDKLPVIDVLLERVDALLVGGAMAFTLLAAQGADVGRSLVEADHLDQVRTSIAKADDRGVRLELPTDVVAASDASRDARTRIVSAREMPSDLMGLDIGPETVQRFAAILADAKTILWNGPMGVFELEPFSHGTRGVALAVGGASAFSVVGGGDSLAAVRSFGLESAIDHLSTGGGASLEFLEGRSLPGITILEEGSAA